ncbi:hypothetical protein [Vibrio gallicus]|uniref:hypothetical protein n=1 Tax=Vibrio gallicus TaxID=190897 RepID=UPI0021C263DE|nr:hypothetical protein [Vibrio gallicus]
MDFYISVSHYILSPAIAVCLALFIVVLTKGEICPGQRGRLHKQLISVLVLLLALVLSNPLLLVPALCLGWFVSQTKRGKTRVEGPIWALCMASATAIITSIIAVEFTSTIQLSFELLVSVLLGAGITHLLMTLARTRLQAFHSILPIAGVISVMLLVLIVLLQSYSYLQGQTEQVVSVIVQAFPVLLIGSVISCWHLFRSIKPTSIQLLISSLAHLTACYLLLPIIYPI